MSFSDTYTMCMSIVEQLQVVSLGSFVRTELVFFRYVWIIMRVGDFGMFVMFFLVFNVFEMYLNQFIITDRMNGVVSIKDSGVAYGLFKVLSYSTSYTLLWNDLGICFATCIFRSVESSRIRLIWVTPNHFAPRSFDNILLF